MVVFPENIHTPSTEGNGNLIECWGGGVQKATTSNNKVTLLLGGVSKQLSYGIVDEHSGRKYSRRSWKFQGWGWSKTKVPSVGRGGRVWIFSGTPHDDVLLLELAANYFKL